MKKIIYLIVLCLVLQSCSKEVSIPQKVDSNSTAGKQGY